MKSIRRIVIIGATGSGKSYLAEQIGRDLHLPVTDLDEHFWLPGWQPETITMFHTKVAAIATQPAWILTGNYSQVRELIWPAADCIIWLDYPFYKVLGRLLYRSIAEIMTGKFICNGNRQSWQRLLSKHGILAWLLSSYAAKRREYRELMTQPLYRDKFFRITSAKDIACLRTRFAHHSQL
jgi:adenylate kinase family enzyme